MGGAKKKLKIKVSARVQQSPLGPDQDGPTRPGLSRLSRPNNIEARRDDPRSYLGKTQRWAGSKTGEDRWEGDTDTRGQWQPQAGSSNAGQSNKGEEGCLLGGYCWTGSLANSSRPFACKPRAICDLEVYPGKILQVQTPRSCPKGR